MVLCATFFLTRCTFVLRKFSTSKLQLQSVSHCHSVSGYRMLMLWERLVQDADPAKEEESNVMKNDHGAYAVVKQALNAPGLHNGSDLWMKRPAFEAP
ncbi:hypothetical protein N7478_004570 [Penicillium angulare]|uniref:uncharacterized protein n=1 Tax=Penicillium angulare TaxID=116970 RepID=UPI00253FD8DB|nr:uncharacterized protein N7478_004570 [Penicillium angulare]KAJ5279198.1 hypothetical protein N7478_004570 [Penicillium angulare]